ncbi:phosphotransferase family protein [Microlunatus sp. Gsoil 973]|jgi:aminoglycoside phosphotransferase (APT) family kinase protein|uniref:phosphotransferase family protein n=1 Tax=Microlunatus sp. Gsoil 973 TaxID=2672569 RepID=UPI0012B45135|nr:aminoglycoside phosphotransferase family protein [Microlunatus sp. Gsoil 973]QGN34025.1 phosphotransferase [Microlunatus sp. Gsoil 973]
MVTTPRSIIESVIRPFGGAVTRLVPLAGGGMNETYRAEMANGAQIVVRIARQPTPWFLDESHLMTRTRDVGVSTPEVLGIEHLDHEGELLSFSIQRFLPGRSLHDLVGELPVADLERLVQDAGEILARIHDVPTDERGIRHQLRMPAEATLAGITRLVADTVGQEAAPVVERGAELLCQQIMTGSTPRFALAQGDFMPKNILVADMMISGVIDWEFAGPAPPAFDLARWEVSAGDPLHDRLDLLHRGYARITDPEVAAAGLTPSYAVDWIFEMLAWKNPASPAQIRRCVDVLARYARVVS